MSTNGNKSSGSNCKHSKRHENPPPAPSEPMDTIAVTIGENANDASSAAESVNLDDAIALMLQLEPENIVELGQVHALIETLISAQSETDQNRCALSNAMGLLNGIMQSASDDPASDFNKTMALLESVRNAQEQQLTPAAERSNFLNHPSPETLAPETGANTPLQKVFELPADADKELTIEFITESKDLLESAEAALLSLETDPENMDSVNTVFRAFHTIKGTSGFLGLSPITEFAHRAESLLGRVRDREIRFGGIYADLALRSADIIKELIGGAQDLVSGKESALPASYGEVMNQLADPVAAAAKIQETASDSVPRLGDILVAQGTVQREQIELIASEKGSEPLGLSLVKKEGIPLESVAGALRLQRQMSSSSAMAAESSLRVRMDRLDRLVDMVGELVIAQSMLSQDKTVHQAINHDLLRKVAHAGKIVRELQDLAMSMRMVPLKGVFQKMARLVRDLAYKSGKTIEFIGEGEETEIDRNMVDVLSDPLVHMIRNAIDHGIEPPDARVAQGKPLTGCIRLSAYHSSGNVVIELQDDGKGLNREKIIEKAAARGLIESDKSLTDSEVYRLIFLPGFSTCDQVSEISGRGVGMDVVRKGVEALHGRIDLSSEAGKGTTFFVRLPLTLAITDGMLVRVGSEKYIIPTINIHLSFRPEPSSLWTVSGRGEMVMLRGDLMPIIRLYRLFNIENAISNPADGLLVVLGEGGQRCALLVDELLGQQQVVAKSLGKGLTKVQSLAGGAILGDGKVGLIIDALEIISLARRTAGISNGSEINGRSAA
jgi:two-component system, chemotaxis family, sensor kinase CheA